MANIALREARRSMNMSQADLARRIREAGFELGDPNGCNKAMIQRWESGKTRRPQARYLLALENVFGQPSANLGFDADIRYGMDRAQVIQETGLDSVLPLPEPAESYGPRTGIYRSVYGYVSSGRGGASFEGKHYVMVLQRGAKLTVRSVPASNSRLSMDLSASGRVVTGTWAEQTRADGWYRGAVYTGAIQMLEDEADATRLDGRWLGFGKEGEINDGPWRLELVDDQVTAEAVERWNREPE